MNNNPDLDFQQWQEPDLSSYIPYSQPNADYLLNAEKRTACLTKIDIGDVQSFTIPDHVIANGIKYTIDSIGLGAIKCTPTMENFLIPSLQHLIIPDSVTFIAFEILRDIVQLTSIQIGKGLKTIQGQNHNQLFNLQADIRIDEENPHFKIENGMVLTRDGKNVIARLDEHLHFDLTNPGPELAFCTGDPEMFIDEETGEIKTDDEDCTLEELTAHLEKLRKTEAIYNQKINEITAKYRKNKIGNNNDDDNIDYDAWKREDPKTFYLYGKAIDELYNELESTEHAIELKTADRHL